MHFSTIYLLTLGVTLHGVSAYPRHDSRADVCFEDNTLRAFERFSSRAAAFCPAYLSSPSTVVPKEFADVKPGSISSACKCFQKTAGTLAPTSTSSASSITTKTSVSTTPSSTSTPVTTPVTTSTSLTTSSTSSTTSTVPTKVASGSSSKRGLVYDWTSKTAYGDLYKGSRYIGFCSNWGSKRAIGNGVTLDTSFPFVPTLRVDGGLNNNDWVNDANAAIQSGSKYLFASNEPDNGGQANLSPAQTAQVYKKYMNQFQGKAKLATPAVTNGGGSTGLNFLGAFVEQCGGCHFDMINIHHYVPRSAVTVDQAVSTLKSYIEKDVPALQAKYPQLQGLPIIIGEFFITGATEAEGGDYLRKMMPYLDSKDTVIGYQAFGGLWPGMFIADNGNGLSPAGDAYRNFG